MRISTRHPLALLAVGALVLSACDTDPGDDAGENELITRVTLTMTPQGGGAAATAEYRDANGDGLIQAGEFSTLTLRAGTTYTGAIAFFDGSEDVTVEVRAESDEHQVVYTAGGAAAGRLTVTATDRDANGKPIGLATTAAVTAGAAASGTLRAVLYHYEAVSAKQAGVPGNDADFDGTFPVALTN